MLFGLFFFVETRFYIVYGFIFYIKILGDVSKKHLFSKHGVD